jgi:hypothetical protein
LFTLGSFQIKEVAHIFELLKFMDLFWQKRIGLHFGRFFSQSHLVALVWNDIFNLHTCDDSFLAVAFWHIGRYLLFQHMCTYLQKIWHIYLLFITYPTWHRLICLNSWHFKSQSERSTKLSEQLFMIKKFILSYCGAAVKWWNEKINEIKISWVCSPARAIFKNL